MGKEKNRQKFEGKPIRARFTKELIKLINALRGKDEKDDSNFKNI